MGVFDMRRGIHSHPVYDVTVSPANVIPFLSRGR